MEFNIDQLSHLDYDDAYALLPDYLDDLVEQFAKSTEGEAYAQPHPNFGRWIAYFTELAYVYEGFTLSKMTKANVQIIMEDVLPRKITLSKRSEAADAIPELVAFWNFLKQEYNFRNAGAITTYLTSIEGKFTDWMFDPAKGGMAKSFIMGGMKAGFDMTTQEGLTAFQQAYNQKILSEKPNDSFLQKLGNLFSDFSQKAPLSPSIPNTSTHKLESSKPEGSTKGFGSSEQIKKSKRKKK